MLPMRTTEIFTVLAAILVRDTDRYGVRQARRRHDEGVVLKNQFTFL